MYLPLFVGVLCVSLFWYALLFVLSSFAIILTRKRELAALLLSSFGCLITVNRKCPVALPRGAVGRSTVCDCGVSCLYSQTFYACIHLNTETNIYKQCRPRETPQNVTSHQGLRRSARKTHC